MKALIKRLKKTQRGAAMVEYGLLVALIAIVAIVALTGLGDSVNETFQEACDTLKNGVNGSATCQ